jgi:hypothetical protein
MTQCFRRPRGGLVSMARSARVRDFVIIGHAWRDEIQRMRSHKCTGNPFRFDFRHVAGNALASGGALLVVRVFF